MISDLLLFYSRLHCVLEFSCADSLAILDIMSNKPFLQSTNHNSWFNFYEEIYPGKLQSWPFHIITFFTSLMIESSTYFEKFV